MSIAHVLQPHAGVDFPGAVVVVERAGEVAGRAAVGHAQTHGGPRRPMTAETIFDVASLTKVCATAPVLMHLVAEGALDLEARVGSLIEEFSGPGKNEVRVRDLLTHRAGLWEWWPLYAEAGDPVAAAAQLPLRYAPGAGRHYSDIGVVIAGTIAERVTGSRIDDLARNLVFEPLGMKSSAFAPSAPAERFAATSTADRYERSMLATGDPYPTGRSPEDFNRWRDYTLVGEVEDGNAHHAFAGVAPHAGLFTTADDVVRLGRAVLDGFAGRSSWLPADAIRTFLEGSLLFWSDRRADFGLGHGGYGHSGFTGAQLFFDPETDLVVVMLTNRTHRTALPYPSILPAWTAVLAAT
jgi:serine-type D-Ala-D-Ala carboxypeptidase